MQNDILIATLLGSWNGSVAMRYAQDLKKHVQAIGNIPWAHLVYLNEWQLGTPEIEPIIKDLELWCLNNQVSVTAIVLSEHALKRYQLQKMVRGKDANMYKVFSQEKEALDWLKNKGFDSPTSSQSAQ